MTSRSRDFVAQGSGIAFAIIAFAAGVSGQALAASPQQAVAARHAVAETTRAVFDASVKPSLSAGRVDVAIDPIDPTVRHRWPDLSDSGSFDPMHHVKS